MYLAETRLTTELSLEAACKIQRMDVATDSVCPDRSALNTSITPDAHLLQNGPSATGDIRAATMQRRRPIHLSVFGIEMIRLLHEVPESHSGSL